MSGFIRFAKLIAIHQNSNASESVWFAHKNESMKIPPQSFARQFERCTWTKHTEYLNPIKWKTSCLIEHVV